MKIAESEYKKKKNIITKVVKKTVKPDWFNKDIKENTATEEEIKELEEYMKRS